MQWYYSKAGVQHGPISQSELQAKLASGEVAAADLVWNEGMSDWIPAAQVEELKVASLRVDAPPEPTEGRVSYGEAPSPYQTPSASTSGPAGERVPSYLWQSIAVTVLCCLPFGIPAIVYAAKVDSLQARGDYQGAVDASRKAKMWCWLAFGFGLAIGIIYLIMAASAGSVDGSWQFETR